MFPERICQSTFTLITFTYVLITLSYIHVNKLLLSTSYKDVNLLFSSSSPKMNLMAKILDFKIRV